MKWDKVAEFLFFGLLSYVALSMSGNMEKIQNGVQELNKQVAVIISENHTAKRIAEDHEIRIRDLEKK